MNIYAVLRPVLRLDVACRTLLAVVISTSVAVAQESRASLSGIVTDPQGASIPAAQVIVKNTGTNAESRTATNETGLFVVPLLNPGTYNVTIESAGFKKLVRNDVVVNVGAQLSLELRMEVGQLAESVEVTADAPLLETRSASGGRLVSGREVAELPVSAMNPFLLAGLAAGMQWTGTPSGMQRAFDVGGTTSLIPRAPSGRTNTRWMVRL